MTTVRRDQSFRREGGCFYSLAASKKQNKKVGGSIKETLLPADDDDTDFLFERLSGLLR